MYGLTLRMTKWSLAAAMMAVPSFAAGQPVRAGAAAEPPLWLARAAR